MALSFRILLWLLWIWLLYPPLVRVLPFFTPPSVRNKVTSYLQGESGCYYTLDAIIYILEKSMRPGTKKTDGDIENTYSWPLNWEMPNLTSDLCKGLSTYHPEIFQLLTSLGRRFIAKFLIALLAADGHFLTVLLSTLWGLRGGFTGGEFGCELVGERIFIMAKGHSLAIRVLKMRIMHGHLGEVSVRRTSERMWKDEMQSDTRGGHHALSFPDSGRQTGERQARVTKVLEEVKWRISTLREVGGLSGAKSLEQRVYHGGGKMWFGAAEEADGLMRKLVDQCRGVFHRRYRLWFAPDPLWGIVNSYMADWLRWRWTRPCRPVETRRWRPSEPFW